MRSVLDPGLAVGISRSSSLCRAAGCGATPGYLTDPPLLYLNVVSTFDFLAYYLNVAAEDLMASSCRRGLESSCGCLKS